MRSIQAWSTEITKRYLTDPEFFARVQIAVDLTDKVCEMESGQRMTAEQAAGCIMSAAAALLVSELDRSSIPGDEEIWYEQMGRAAEALGMTVVRTDA